MQTPAARTRSSTIGAQDHQRLSRLSSGYGRHPDPRKSLLRRWFCGAFVGVLRDHTGASRQLGTRRLSRGPLNRPLSWCASPTASSRRQTRVAAELPLAPHVPRSDDRSWCVRRPPLTGGRVVSQPSSELLARSARALRAYPWESCSSPPTSISTARPLGAPSLDSRGAPLHNGSVELTGRPTGVRRSRSYPGRPAAHFKR
jgi:hypothetical protein